MAAVPSRRRDRGGHRHRCQFARADGASGGWRAHLSPSRDL